MTEASSLSALIERVLESGDLLAFDYVNWRDKGHRYVIEPEGMEFGPYDSGGKHRNGPFNWVLHGMVVTRDGDARPEMNPNRRRTFLMDGLRNVASVRRSR